MYLKHCMICYVILQTIVTGLPTNAGYSLHIAGVTKSLHSNMHYIGEFSKPWTFILYGKKDSLKPVWSVD